MAAMSMMQRQHFEDKVQRFRKLVNRTPRWHPAEVDGRPVMVDDSGVVVLRFEGPWTPDLARLFTHLTHDVGLSLLALLEAAPGTAAQGQAVRFLDALYLDGRAKTLNLPHE
ncbi:hypothetical protein [Umezawaea sp. NPDC059074]|uniref:hypothetical protein n=1 Tax=Umezawaea sp. NPDC059074 TaxID=3346716 RepID=UPI0036C26731